jgi:hypothetical protein
LEFVEKYDKWFCQRCGRAREPEGEETYIRKRVYYESPLFGTRKNKQIMLTFLISLLLILIPVIILLLPTYEDDERPNGGSQTQDDWRDWPKYPANISESGYTGENDSSEVDLYINMRYTTSIKITLNWTDEASSYFRGTNEPDEFRLSIMSPKDIDIYESSFDISGNIFTIVNLDPDEDGYAENYLGTWTVVVEAGTCGDDYVMGGFRSTQDGGNSWQLEITYYYHLQEDYRLKRH